MKYFKKNFEAILLVIIILAGFLLRFVNFTSIPVGFNADEASFGYDTYSILKTGKDQWGVPIPLVLKSFGDYKSPLYSYLSIPFVFLMGLNIASTRILSILIGTLSIASVYLLANQVYKNKLGTTNLSVGIFASLFFALNPWTIMLSRGAYEANLLTLFIPLFIYFFLRGLQENKYLVYSAISLALSLFSYHSSKIIAPALLFVIVLLYIKELKTIGFKKLRMPILILFISFIAIFYTLKIGGGARISERSITQGALEEGAKEKIRLIQQGVNPIKAKLMHNKYQVVLYRFVFNYSQYFSSKFLFTNGAGESYYGMVTGIGVINIFEGIAMLGLLPILFRRKIETSLLLVFAWLFISPLPAALSTGIGYAGNRAVGMIPVLQVLASVGLVGWLGIFSKLNKTVLYLLACMFCVIVFSNIYSFVTNYFVTTHKDSYGQMLYGNLETAHFLTKNKSENIILSRSLSEPQIFIAFASIWDPTDYQEATKEWDLKKHRVSWVDQIESYKLGKYTIKSIDWKKDIGSGVTVVARPSDVNKDFKPDKTVYYPYGDPAIYVKNY